MSRNKQRPNSKNSRLESQKKKKVTTLYSSISSKEIPVWALNSTSTANPNWNTKSNLSSFSKEPGMNSLSLRMAGLMDNNFEA